MTATVTIRQGDRAALSTVLQTAEPPSKAEQLVLDELERSIETAVERAGGRLKELADIRRLAEPALRDRITDAIRAMPSADLDPIGPTVRILREEQGITLADLARVMGLHRGTVSAWERATRDSRIYVTDVRRAARAIGYESMAIVRVAVAIMDREHPQAARP